MNTTIKAFGGLNPEWVDGGFKLPSDLLMEAEEKYGSVQADYDLTRTTMTTAEAIARAEAFFAKEIGRKVRTKRGMLTVYPKYATKYMVEAMEGLTNPDDIIAASCWAITRCKDIAKWVETQKAARRAQNSTKRVQTTKSEGKWKDAEVCELPPLMRNAASEVRHQPSAYMIRLPNGKLITTGRCEGKFNVRLYEYPSQGLQGLASRAGINKRGGDTEILRELIGDMNIVPAYTTVWAYNRWNTIVGWRRPDVSPTKYWLDQDGKITEEPQDEQAPLNHSELLYEHLRDCATFSVIQEDGSVDYVVEEEDESYMAGNERAAEDIGIDFKQYNDDEQEVLYFLREVLETSEGSLSEGDLRSTQAQRALLGEPVGLTREGEQIWADGLMGAKWNLKRMKLIKEPSEKQVEIMEALKSKIIRFERMIDTYTSMTEFNQKYQPRRHGVIDPPVIEYVQPKGSEVLPENNIAPQVLHEAAKKPEGMSFKLRLLKRGTTTLLPRNGKLHRYTVPTVKEQPTSARNASERLKAVLRRMIREDLEEALRA